MAVASHFIDLTDGAYHVIPPDAKNLILVVEGGACTGGSSTGSETTKAACDLVSGSFAEATCKLIISHDKVFEKELSTAHTIISEISDKLLLYVKKGTVTNSPTSIKLYYGV